MRTRVSAFAVAVILCAGSFRAAADNLIDTAEATPELKMFVEALHRTGLNDSLRTGGPYTVFAPTDSAFNNMPMSTRDEILGDNAKLAKVLEYHVLRGKTLNVEVRPGRVNTVEGGTLSLESDNGLVKVNGARVIQSDLEADNGVIHVIDTVLQPER